MPGKARTFEPLQRDKKWRYLRQHGTSVRIMAWPSHALDSRRDQPDLQLMTVARPATIHGRVFAHAEDPERPFVTLIREERTTALTYGELSSRSRRYARLYRDRKVSAGDVVAIVLPQSVELYPAFLGALSIGAVPTVLPARAYRQDPEVFWSVQNIVLSRLRAVLVVTDPEIMPELRSRSPENAERAVDASSLPHHENEVDAEISPDQSAFLQHSSGTTGPKKGVLLSHGAALEHIDTYSALLEISPGDRVVTWLPHYHDMGLIGCFLLPAIAGIRVVCLDPFEWVLRPTRFLEVIEEYRCTIGWLPNFAFHHIVRSLPKDAHYELDSLRAVIDCSEPCKPETLDTFHGSLAAFGLRREALQVSYAMAENVLAVTQTALGREPRTLSVDRDGLLVQGRVVEGPQTTSTLRLLSCGPPLPNVRVSIRSAAGAPLPENTVGRIAVSAATLFTGYAGGNPRPETEDGWYLTSDLGFLNQGELFVVGRSEDVLIINGRNLYAHEIEHVVNCHTSAKAGRCAALGVYNPSKGSEDLVLIVESNGEAAPELRKRIGEVVTAATGVAPHLVRFVEPGWLSKTTSGKFDRKANLARYEAESAKGR